MKANAMMIDTLRFADRLKGVGVPDEQAEGISRALNDELASGMVTKADLDDIAQDLRESVGAVESGLRADVAKLDTRLGKLEAKVGGGFEAMDAKFEARFEAMDAKFEAMDAKFDAVDAKFEAADSKISTVARYGFLMMALLIALGVYNAAGPRPGATQTEAQATPARPAGEAAGGEAGPGAPHSP